MSIPIQDNIWAITAIIGLFGILAVHRLTEKRNKTIEFRTAAKEFRNTVLNELKDVYPVAINWPDSIDSYLRARFITLQNAVANFESVLPFYKRYFFIRAWRVYCVGKDHTSKNAEQKYHQYMGFTINEHYIDPKKQLHKNISQLLKNAKT